ncbi:uncharacterized protein LOC131224192 [Magnolia sinica]|uniref:uncharacterized protein LOC131224192 n=1 Tax=Magnolia sinica TaxID=86752 RepID=UPI0026589AA9|nr:uncharacterized protein LOC131224192 [Magnolia sinica]
MGKLGFGRVLDCLCLRTCSNSSFCMNSLDNQDDMERRALIGSDGGQMMRTRDVADGNQTLAFHLKPKVFLSSLFFFFFFLCGKCGVTSFQVDLETKKVIVMGDIAPFEVLESVSKVKTAQLWTSPY